MVEIHQLEKKYGQKQVLHGIGPYRNQIIRLTILLILLVVVSLIPYPTLFDETNRVCIHHYLFGFQCPFCGMTHAVYETMHLNFASAINYNVVVALLPLYFLMDISSIWIRGNWLLKAKKITIIFIVAALLFLYVFRIGKHFNWF